MSEKILEVKDLVVNFKTDAGLITAVDGVSFDVYRGRTLGIVGESGCGKSVTALSIMRLIPDPPGIISGGEILYKGKNILGVPMHEMRSIRGNKIAMIFQEPMTSLNPVFTCGNQIMEAIALHQRDLNARQRRERAVELFDLVGIPAPRRRIDEYPHQLSGGMRQRVMIAMSLALNPDILIADEPTTALDVTIQAQIMELLQKLQKELGMGIIMITHDLGVVAEVCDDVMIMYCGRTVESSDIYTIFETPGHPYTKGLLKSIPSFDSTTGSQRNKLPTIDGMVPSLFDLPAGCSFQNRCINVTEDCRGRMGVPQMRAVGTGHKVSCFNPLKQ